MSKIVALMALAAVCGSMRAEKRSLEDARSIASEKMTELGLVCETPQLATRRIVAMDADSETPCPYYVFNSDNDEGFVIVSGEDCLPDIVGYSTAGCFDEDDMPEGLAHLLEAYQCFVDDIDAGEESAISRARQIMAIRRTSDSGESNVVEPLLGDIQWGQGSPYNNQCPTIEGNATVAGCASIAMAQIMKYHNCPQYLLADIPGYTYECTYNGNTYSVIIGDVSAGTEYDWDNMLSSYTGVYTDEQAEAVSTLIYHCGVAAKTEYNTGTSHTNSSLSMWYEYFGFDADLVQNLSAQYFSLSDWVSIIEKELASSRPIFMRGQRQSSSHAFVCDGMDGTGLFHINWGWKGSYNGYFDITMLNPYSDNDGYCRNSRMYVGLTPDNGVEDEPLYEKGIAISYRDSIPLTLAERAASSDTFSGSISYRFLNSANEDFSGIVALCFVGEDEEITLIGESMSLSISAPSDGSYSSRYKTLTFSYAFPVGVYAIMPVYSTDGGVTWNRCDRSEYYGFLAESTETALTYADRSVSATASIEEELLTGIVNTIRLDVSNSFNLDYKDYLYFYGDTINTQPSSCTEELYIRVPANGSKSYDIDVEVGNAETYYVWVEDANGNLLVDGKSFEITYNPTPVLTITGVATNASTTDYETKNAFINSNRVKVPIIYDDKFILNSTIVNDGGEYRGDFYVKKRTLNSSGSYTLTTIRTTRRTIPANSTITFSDTVYSYEFDDQLANVDILKVSDGIELNEISGALKIYMVNSSGYYNLDSNRAMGYFYEPSGINNIETDELSIVVAEGCIMANSSSRQTIGIYNISGQLVKIMDLEAGEIMSVSLTPGIYIIDGKKILVR